MHRRVFQGEYCFLNRIKIVGFNVVKWLLHGILHIQLTGKYPINDAVLNLAKTPKQFCALVRLSWLASNVFNNYVLTIEPKQSVNGYRLTSYVILDWSCYHQIRDPSCSLLWHVWPSVVSWSHQHVNMQKLAWTPADDTEFISSETILIQIE